MHFIFASPSCNKLALYAFSTHFNPFVRRLLTTRTPVWSYNPPSYAPHVQNILSLASHSITHVHSHIRSTTQFLTSQSIDPEHTSALRRSLIFVTSSFCLYCSSNPKFSFHPTPWTLIFPHTASSF